MKGQAVAVKLSGSSRGPSPFRAPGMPAPLKLLVCSQDGVVVYTTISTWIVKWLYGGPLITSSRLATGTPTPDPSNMGMKLMD